jgi:probable HAF family extracellular repeat protein
MQILSRWLSVSVLAGLSNVATAQVGVVGTGTRVPSYTMTDLSINSPFPDAFAYSVSQNGKITGTGTDPISGELHAFVYHAGVFQDLGDLGYPYGADGVSINNSGQVAATGYGPGYQALLYSNGHVTHLGSIDGGYSEGISINNLGHIVGRAQNGDGGLQGFSYINGHFNALSVDIARCINDSDQFVGSVGFYWTYGGYIHGVEHAFLSSGGAVTDLGDIGGGTHTNTEAFGINNAGDVTGYSTAVDGTQHAFLYSGGVLQDLGTIAPYYTCGISINNSGTILGTITTYVGGQIGAFVYANGGMHDLQTLLGPSGAAWSQLVPLQINDNGWIVGYGTINGAGHGFLARPVTASHPH